MSYRIVFTKIGAQEFEAVNLSPLKHKAARLFNILKTDPLQPPCAKLTGALEGAYSRQINFKHRLVYYIDDEAERVVILRMLSQ